MGRRSNARTRLLTAGDQLFRDNGFASVGVAQLCASAGVNKGSFYHFFSSKRALLLEVIEAAWDETGMFRQWESSIPELPLEQIRTFLKELFAFHYADQESAGRVRGSLVANIGLELGPDDSEVAQLLASLLKREEAAFEQVLNAAVERGEISLGNPGHSAQALVACLHGLLMMAKIKDDLSVFPAAETSLLRLAGVNSYI